ncbi:MAG: DUF433 domain-containing protein [Anaerolineae bacterium]|nr:DUF433 domain-containing protein [Anaerolineae bacterium]
MATIHPIDTIMSDPGNRGGQPIIVDTSIRVVDIVASHIYRGLPPEELATNFALDMGQVYAALAYYYQHKPEMDARMRKDADAAERLLADFDAKGKLIRVE